MKVKKFLHIIHFALSLSSEPLSQAEFKYIEKNPILYFRIPHNTLCLPPKFCINYSFQMLLGAMHIPKSI